MKKDITTLAPVTDPPTLATRIAKAKADCAFVLAEPARKQEAARIGGVEPFRPRLEPLMATARELLPLAEAFWQEAASVVAAARELPRSPALDMRIGRADISSTLRQYAEGLTRSERFLAGDYAGGDLEYEVKEITGLLTLAPFIPAYHAAALSDLCEAITEVKATVARQAGRPIGPTVQPPAQPRGEPIGPPIVDFNVFDFGRK